MGKRLQIQFYNESNGESLSLPINPASISLPSEMNTQTYNIIDYGEVNRIGSRQIRRAVFTNLFPEDNSFLNFLPATFSNAFRNIYSMFFSQKDTIEKIQNWQYNKNIIRVIVSDYYNVLMQIVRFEPLIEERSGAVTYTLDFAEYRNPEEEMGGDILDLLPSGLMKRVAVRAIPPSVVAKANDDVFGISKRYTGDGNNWKSIAEKNNLSVDDKIDGKGIVL